MTIVACFGVYLEVKKTVEYFYSLLTSGNEKQRDLATDLLADDVIWCAAHPINDLRGKEAFLSNYWHHFHRAMPDLERRAFIVMEGEDEGRKWVTTMGCLVGTFKEDLFGVPATGRAVYIRFGELIALEGGKITEAYIIPDFIDVMDQAGVNPLRDSLGKPGPILPPMTMDGLTISDPTGSEGAKTKALVDDMIAGLLRYDGKSLLSMDQENYWHPDFMWYGPAAIGTTRGLEGFRKHHQGPFLKGFPDRDVCEKACYFAEGNYAVTGGWPHMKQTHTGEGWLGLPATGRYTEPRVFDFWRREGDKLKENWVFIDIIHLLSELGFDVFGQMELLKAK